MKMTILPRVDDVTHVALAGRFDTTGAEDINESFAQATVGRLRPAVVDLSEIEFLASRGIGVLLQSGNKLRKAGFKLVLLNPQPLVEAALRTTRVDAVTPIAADLDEALRIVQGVSASSSAASPQPQAAAKSRPPQSEPEPAAPPVLEGELRLAIKNEIGDLKNVVAALAKFLDAHHVPHRAAYAVNLAVDELVVNVMHYAYVDDDPHIINLDLAIQGDQAILRLVDDGRPFDPRTGPALDLNAEERRVGGLGLIMVLDMVDVLRYERVEENNCVEVRVRLIADAQQAPSPLGEVVEGAMAP